jgi:D-alanine-D-alanine ligase
MHSKINVLIIFGGKSTEHEVSVRSARSIYNALDPEKYRVIPVGIAKNGAWVKGETVQKVLESGSRIEEIADRTAILPDPNSRQLVNLSHNLPAGKSGNIDVVFPVLHGPLGEDGTIQGLLELANLPYVGCGVLASALGMDKVLQKEIMIQNQIPVVDYYWFTKSAWQKNQPEILANIKTRFKDKFPLFVKPPNSGSSVGVSKVRSQNELIKAIDTASLYDRKILVEQGIEGAREIETSVLGNDNPEVSVCGEIRPKAEFYDYDAKYTRDDTDLVIPADLTPELSHKVRDIARRAFLAIDGAGMVRADFFVNSKTGRVWLNELNTIPGFTSISMYPKLWEKSGVTFTELVDRLITLARERWQEKQKLKTSK